LERILSQRSDKLKEDDNVVTHLELYCVFCFVSLFPHSNDCLN